MAQFQSIKDVYADFCGKFNDIAPVWSLEQLRTWLHGQGHTRYELLDGEIVDHAYEAAIWEYAGVDPETWDQPKGPDAW